KTASGAMISRAVETAVNAGLRLEELYTLQDQTLIAMLASRFGREPGMMRLLESFAAHHIYQRCYVLTRAIGEEKQSLLVAQYHRDRPTRETAEATLIRRCKLKPGELIVYCPSEKMMLKEAHVLVKVDGGPPRMLSSLGMPEVAGLMDKHRNLWKFYVFVARERADRRRAISAVCEEYFGETNHLPGLQSGQMYLHA
ncbi:MAG: hypothetical protein ACYCW6_18980, partial [Candidatus Xenobia bacterium]